MCVFLSVWTLGWRSEEDTGRPDPSCPTLCSMKLTGALNMVLGARIQVSTRALIHWTISPAPLQGRIYHPGGGKAESIWLPGGSNFRPCLSDNKQPSEDISFLGSPPRVWEPGGTVVGNGCPRGPWWGDYRTPAWASAPSSDLLFLFLFLTRLISLKCCKPQGPPSCAVDSRQWHGCSKTVALKAGAGQFGAHLGSSKSFCESRGEAVCSQWGRFTGMVGLAAKKDDVLPSRARERIGQTCLEVGTQTVLCALGELEIKTC